MNEMLVKEDGQFVRLNKGRMVMRSEIEIESGLQERVGFMNLYFCLNVSNLRTEKGVFWVNIAKSEINLHYKNCSNLFGILRREIEFRYYCCRNSTKSMREKKKKVERENVEFRQWGYRISYAQFCCPGVRGVRGVPEVKRKKNIYI